MASIRTAVALVSLLTVVACGGSDDGALDDGSGGGGSGGAGATGGAAGAGGTAGAGGSSGASGSGGDGGSSGSGGASCAGKTGTAGDFDLTVSIGGEERRYLLHVPASYDGSTAVPFVLSFHGWTESPEDIRQITHLDRVADDRGFIVAFPEGKGKSWAGGACCSPSNGNGTDDVGFTRAVIDAVALSHCTDEKRVYATGFSNGGFFSHRLACELSDRIAAIGVGSGQNTIEPCSPSRAVPVIQVHGTSDFVVPYIGNPLFSYPPTKDTMTEWAARNGCSATSHPTEQQGSASCESWGPCAEGSDVVLCTVQGGGHEWFGGGSKWTADGPPPGSFQESYAVMDFLEQHSLP